MSASWKEAARLFFAERAGGIEGVPTLEDLCWVSGRDPRLWKEEALFQDMMSWIEEVLDLDRSHRLLEVGCASGFLARGLAPRCGEYLGLDVAEPALSVARRLGLSNARFERADATALPQPDGHFDRVLSYDVFTNFPDMGVAGRIVAEMARVTRPGGRLMVGSLPHVDAEERAARRAAEVAALLNERDGPLDTSHRAAREGGGLRKRLERWIRRTEPQIVCYAFRPEDFVALGEQLGLETRILDVHPKHPYRDCRFDVVFRKAS